MAEEWVPPEADTQVEWTPPQEDFIPPEVVKPVTTPKIPGTVMTRFGYSSANNQLEKDQAKVQQFAHDVGSAFKQGYGSEPIIGWGPESTEFFQKYGVWNSARNVDQPILGFARTGVRMIMDGIPGIADTIMRGTNGLMAAGSAAAGQIAGDIAAVFTGPTTHTETDAGLIQDENGNVIGFNAPTYKKVVNEGTNTEVKGLVEGGAWDLMNALMLDAMGRGGLPARMGIDPMTLTETKQPIGYNVPKPEDFTTTAKILGDEKATKKVEEAYKEQGIFPSEIASDAQKDVTITQDVLTNQPTIKAYNEPPRTPEQWMQENVRALFTMTSEEFTKSVEASGMKADDVLAYIEARPEAPVSVWQSDKGWTVSWIDPKYGTSFQARSSSDGIPFSSQQEAFEFAQTKAKKLYDNEQVYVEATKEQTEVVTEAVKKAKEKEAAAPKETPKEESKAPEEKKPLTSSEADKAIDDKLSIGEGDQPKVYTLDQIYTRFIDDLNPVRTAFRNALIRLRIKKELVENTAQDPVVLFRLLRGVYGKADSFIRYGTRDFFSGKINGESLETILKPVKKDMEGFRRYIASKRAIELAGRGIDAGINIEAAGIVVTRDAMKYEAISQQLIDFQNRIVKYYKDAGMLSDEAYEAMLKANQSYTPFFRHFDPEEGVIGGRNVSRRLGASQAIKKIQGSERDIIDPVESVIKNVYTYLSLADKNAAGLKLVDWLKAADEDSAWKMLEKIDEKEATVKDLEGTILEDAKRLTAKDNTISVYRNGKRETYKVADPDLVATWRGLDSQTASVVTRIAALPASWLRAGSTLMPDFIARNLIRDLMTAVVNTKGVVFSPIDTLKGAKGAIMQDKDFQDWLAAGGANSAMVSLDRKYLQANIAKLNKDTGLIDRGWNVVKYNNPVVWLRMMSELAENSTRLGEFKKLSRSTKAEMQASAYSSREVTLDFSRIGSQMRAANMISAFLNANLQGTDRLARAFAENPKGTTAKIVAGITIPSIILYEHNKDDPRYQNLPDWVKDLYWIFITDDWQPSTAADIRKRNLPSYLWRKNALGQYETNEGTIFKVPKPFEVGILFGTGAERALEAYEKKSLKGANSLIKSLVDAFTPQVLPTASVPILEQFANRSFFTGDPIVSDWLSQQLPEYQYTQYTSATAKALGQNLAAFSGIRNSNLDPNSAFGGVTRAITSPAMLENYVRGWSGGMGITLLQIADAGLQKAGILAPPPVKPTATLADIPFIKAFVVRYPSASVQSLQDFRARNEANNRVMDTFKIQAQKGNFKASQTIMALYRPRATLDGVQKAINEQSALIQKINDNPSISAPEKRQLIDSLYYSMIQLSINGNKMLDELDKVMK